MAALTRDGRTLMRKAWRQQRSDLRALFFDRLDDDQLRTLVEIWTCASTLADAHH